MRLLIALFVSTMILMPRSVGAAERMQAGVAEEIAEGGLSQRTFADGAGRPEQAFILELAAPICLTGPEETDKVPQSTRIHVYASDRAVAGRIKQFLGKKVHVRGHGVRRAYRAS